MPNAVEMIISQTVLKSAQLPTIMMHVKLNSNIKVLLDMIHTTRSTLQIRNDIVYLREVAWLTEAGFNSQTSHLPAYKPFIPIMCER